MIDEIDIREILDVMFFILILNELFNPISGDVYHVRWSGGGKFTSPMNFRSITPNATKLSSVVVLHERSKKLYMGLLFPR